MAVSAKYSLWKLLSSELIMARQNGRVPTSCIDPQEYELLRSATPVLDFTPLPTACLEIQILRHFHFIS